MRSNVESLATIRTLLWNHSFKQILIQVKYETTTSRGGHPRDNMKLKQKKLHKIHYYGSKMHCLSIRRWE